jgi:hypothetical protein
MPISKLCTVSLVTLLVTVLPAEIGKVGSIAIPSAQAQVQDARKAEADRLLDQGLQQFQTSQFEAALQSWQQALVLYREIQDRQSEGWALGNLGLAYDSLGNYAKAIEYYQQVLAIAREIQDRQSEWSSSNNLGLALYHSGQVAAAEQPLRDAIAVLETQRQGLQEAEQLSLVETQKNPYLNLQQVLVALKQPAAALEIAERSRARVFVEQLCQRFAPNQTEARCPNLSPISLAQIQQVARTQNATLVEYAIIPYGKPSLYIWVVSPSGQVSFQQPPPNPGHLHAFLQHPRQS